MLELFVEVGGGVPEYFSSRTHFAKIEDKKLLRKIKSKNLSAGVVHYQNRSLIGPILWMQCIRKFEFKKKKNRICENFEKSKLGRIFEVLQVLSKFGSFTSSYGMYYVLEWSGSVW